MFARFGFSFSHFSVIFRFLRFIAFLGSGFQHGFRLCQIFQTLLAQADLIWHDQIFGQLDFPLIGSLTQLQQLANFRS